MFVATEKFFGGHLQLQVVRGAGPADADSTLGSQSPLSDHCGRRRFEECRGTLLNGMRLSSHARHSSKRPPLKLVAFLRCGARSEEDGPTVSVHVAPHEVPRHETIGLSTISTTAPHSQPVRLRRASAHPRQPGRCRTHRARPRDRRPRSDCRAPGTEPRSTGN